MMCNSPDMFYRYWGKALPPEDHGLAYHLLPYHCLDVAASGKILLKHQPELLKRFGDLSGLDPRSFKDWSAFLLAIHDVGKFADGFQNLRPDLFQKLQGRNIQAIYNERHDTLGYRFCMECIIKALEKKYNQGYESNISKEDMRDLLAPWFCAITGHHGRPPKVEMYPAPINKQFPDQVYNDALAFIQDMMALFMPCGLPFNVDAYDCFYNKFKHISWLMAGLAITADWIGSNQYWFPYHTEPMPLANYWSEIALPRAERAVAESGLITIRSAPPLGVQKLFPFITTPTPLQKLSQEIMIEDGPQLFIIEEVTGGGKTEAAITLAHRIMAKGLASGLFMALPTMATANAMHKRVKDIYRKLFNENSHPSLILAHSASQMTLDLEGKNVVDIAYGHDDRSASQDCTDWLSDSRKKALLAHVGIGTIDQALLAVLPIRHQSLRLIGLSCKVLIVDEVHACDAYVHRLLCTLLRFHAAYGNSAILLSATLPQAMRAELINSFAEGIITKDIRIENNDYPMLTYFSTKDIKEIPIAARLSVSRHVSVQSIHSVDEINKILQETLEIGSCVCWVRNTVYDALQAYHEWVDRLGEARVMLFHARFTLGDRLKIEKKVNENFGKKSEEKDRKGKLLIATQVVEQSLDIDFDFMVTDLAPIDLLIQRAGRLHRHTRGSRMPPVLGIYMPEPLADAGKDWFRGMFPKAAGVYEHHGQLWLTAKWMYERGGFSMPDDARDMIEWVYGDQQQTNIPQGLQVIEDNCMGKDSADHGLARLNSLKLDEGYMSTMTQWHDDIFTPTRLCDPMITIRLARIDGQRLVPWIFNDTGHDWELSQISIRKSLIEKESPGNLSEFVTAAKKTMPDEGRYCIVIPMQQQSDGIWVGNALNKRNELITITYNNRTGLEVNKEE